MSRLRNNQSGFSAVEAVLVVVIIAAIAGVGYYVMRQKHNSTTLSNGAPATTRATAPAGTSANIDQITQQDEQAEAGVDHAADSQTTQDATSANSALNNMGGAYNEASL